MNIAYASAYQPGRVCPAELARGETRTFEVNFNGALRGETIVGAVWEQDRSDVVTLSAIAHASGVVSVTGTGAAIGEVGLRCTATTSAGRKLTQFWCLDVYDLDQWAAAASLVFGSP